MFLSQRNYYLPLTVLFVSILFSCAKQDVTPQQDVSGISKDELKMKIQTDEVTANFKLDEVEEFEVLLSTSASIDLNNSYSLMNQSWLNRRIDHLEKMRSMYPELSSFPMEDQLEMVFGVTLNQSEIEQSFEKIKWLKSDPCETIRTSFYMALNAGYEFLAIGDHDGANAMAELAGEMTNLFKEFCM